MTDDRDLLSAARQLRDETADAAANVDLRASVLSRLDEPRRRPRRWLALAPILVTAVALLWWRWPSSTAAMSLSSTQEVIVTRGDERRVVAGRSVAVKLPAELVAASSAGATLANARVSLRLWPATSIRVETPTRVKDLVGGASITTSEPITITTDHATVTARGDLDLEAHREGAPMTLTRNHRIAGAVALAVVVYAGYATVSSRSGEERIEAPGAAVLDDRGRLTRLDPRAAASRGSAATTGKGGGTGDEGEASVAISGAYWDEAEKRIIFALDGQVFDGLSGEPIVSFDVEARPIERKDYAGKRVSRSFTGRADGDFTLNNVGLGTWLVRVRAAGYAPSSQIVDLGDLYANPLLQFPLTEGAQLTGRVIDWKGRAVEGASVGQSECLARGESRPGCSLVKTEKNGAFTLPALPEEEVFALRAEHPRYGFAEHKNLRQEPGQTRHVVIQLSGVARIHGRVTRGASASPVAGATVTAEGEQTVSTDNTGAYEMLVPLAARPEVWVTRDPATAKTPVKIASHPDNRSTRDVRWVDADTHVAEIEIDFQLQMESARIFGRLTDEAGKPIASARLSFNNTAGWKRGRGHETFPTETVTDADGRYRIDDVPSEAGYRVHYMAEGHDLSLLGFVSVPAEKPIEANFTLGTGSIRGAFVDNSGKPFAAGPRGCQRLGARSTDHVFHMASCLEDGRFEFQRLPPGIYSLENRQPKQNSPIEITATSVEVAPGAVVDGVEIIVSGDESRLWRLRILDGEDRFVAGAFTRYSIGQTSFTSNLQVGDDGVAKIQLPRGHETLFIDAPGFDSAPLDLTKLDSTDVVTVRLKRR